MSDLSGPAFRNGYESYITGYALSGSRLYCLARTWFAPELPRPGCVWTHSLLIRDEDVARIKDFNTLNRLFRRPTVDSYSTYERRLQLNVDEQAGQKIDVEPSAVLEGLYGSSKKIVVPGESSKVFEGLVLAIMGQQWPRLRRSFRFCTGALSIRDTEFDLSISPPEITHSIGPDGVVISQKQVATLGREGWLEIARSDLQSGNDQSDYRQFLWLFGPDYQDGRLAFKPLSEIFVLLQNADGALLADSLLTAVSHYFPRQFEAQRIKKAIFGRLASYTEKLGGEATILRLLVSHPAASSIGDEVSEVRVRATELSRKDIKRAAEIATLAAQLGGANAQPFIDGFLNLAEWPAEVIESVSVDLASMILDRHPRLIANPALWLRQDRVMVLSKFFSRIERDQSLLTSTLAAIVSAGAADAAIVIVDRFGTAALKAIFDELETRGATTNESAERLISALTIKPSLLGELFDSDAIGPRTLWLLSGQLDPRSWYVRSIKYSLLLEAAKQPSKFKREEQALHSALFFLSLGLASWEDEGAELVSTSFSQIFEAVKSDKLDAVLWRQLEPNLTWHSPSWDKCARLVKTVGGAFRERKWPLEYFCPTFKTVEQTLLALEEISEMWSGSRLIKKLKESASRGELRASGEQLAVIAAFNS
jgi:hypothetical protein